jgi:hypothetical protein
MGGNPVINSRDKATGRFIPRGNVYKIIGDVVYCYNKAGELLFFTDACLCDKISKYSWCKLAKGYSTTHIDGKQVAAHRIISDCPSGKIVDHRNHNKKDNRIENLRIATKSTNAFNSIKSSNRSGRQGVWWRQDTKKWSAEIKVMGKKHALGCFSDYDDAVKAREKAEEKYTEGFAYEYK